MSYTLLWSGFFIFSGAFLLIWRRKRKFDRLNEHGIEAYTSYSSKLRSEAFDSVLLWLGCASIIISTYLLIVSN